MIADQDVETTKSIGIYTFSLHLARYLSAHPLCEAMGEAGCPHSNDSEAAFVKAMDRSLATPPEIVHGWAARVLHCHHWPTVADRIVQELSTA